VKRYYFFRPTKPKFLVRISFFKRDRFFVSYAILNEIAVTTSEDNKRRSISDMVSDPTVWRKDFSGTDRTGFAMFCFHNFNKIIVASSLVACVMSFSFLEKVSHKRSCSFILLFL